MAARRRRWALQCRDELQVDLQRHYGQICAHVAVDPVGAPGRGELPWALEQVEQVLQRRRQQEYGPAEDPFVLRAQGVATDVLAAAAGTGTLLLSLL